MEQLDMLIDVNKKGMTIYIRKNCAQINLLVEVRKY